MGNSMVASKNYVRPRGDAMYDHEGGCQKLKFEVIGQYMGIKLKQTMSIQKLQKECCTTKQNAKVRIGRLVAEARHIETKNT
jgi:hypothetical protein